MANLLDLAACCDLLTKSGVIAYPTEAVFGLGCDPDCESAVMAILTLKQRPIEKGLILIASNYEQLIPYIDEQKITPQQKAAALSSWPGPVTWVMPKNINTPYFLTGQFDSIAVRVTAHPLVQKLCSLFAKPLVSTSANISGHEPCRTVVQIQDQFGINFPTLNGCVGEQARPSTIREIQTGQIIRQG